MVDIIVEVIVGGREGAGGGVENSLIVAGSGGSVGEAAVDPPHRVSTAAEESLLMLKLPVRLSRSEELRITVGTAYLDGEETETEVVEMSSWATLPALLAKLLLLLWLL